MSNLVPFADIQNMADAVARSGLFGMKSYEQALALMLVAQSEGQHPASITQDYDIIQGRATRKTHSVLSRFQQMGGMVEWHELTDQIADATFSHKAGGKLRMTWTFEQAQKVGLTNKDNWKNYPRAMLRSRCIAEGVRAVFPAALGGMLVSEEAQDLPATELQAVPLHASKREDVRAALPAESPERTALIELLNAIADTGTDAFRTEWKRLTQHDRTIVRDMTDAFKARCDAADKRAAETIDAEVVEAE